MSKATRRFKVRSCPERAFSDECVKERWRWEFDELDAGCDAPLKASSI